MKYGKLEILAINHKKKYSNGTVIEFAKCKCDCGNVKVINFNNIKRGLVKSCGCIVKTQKGNSKTRLYQAYKHLLHRCYDEKDVNYKNYGARGITVCDEWKNSFLNFKEWAECNGYADNLTIERKDVNGNYEPSNCCWVTMKIQQNNRTNNRLITYNGETKTITQWAEYCGLSYRNLYYRLKAGYSIEKAIEKPKRCLKRLEKVQAQGLLF